MGEEGGFHDSQPCGATGRENAALAVLAAPPGEESREDESVLDACPTVVSGAWITSNCYVPSV